MPEHGSKLVMMKMVSGVWVVHSSHATSGQCLLDTLVMVSRVFAPTKSWSRQLNTHDGLKMTFATPKFTPHALKTRLAESSHIDRQRLIQAGIFCSALAIVVSYRKH
jgi:hypothetical protein